MYIEMDVPHHTSSKYHHFHQNTNTGPTTRFHFSGKQLYSQMPITPPYASVNSSPVWELRATAVDSNKTQQPHTKGKTWGTYIGQFVSLVLSHP